MAKSEVAKNPSLDKKRTIVILQWLVVIVTSYLMLFSGESISQDPWVYGLVLLLLATVFTLDHLPQKAFQHRFFDASLLLMDTALLSAAIYVNRDASWDLFLFYFFILFLAAVGESMLRIVFGSVIVSLIYIALFLQQGKALEEIGPELFVRIPFLFGVSILYGYLAESANRERRRAETAEQRERMKMDLVSSLAHDIKNPLGLIIGYAEIVKETMGQQPEEKEKSELLGRIHANALRIIGLVTGFLDASKAEAGKLEISQLPISVNRLLEEAARQQESDIRKRELKLELNLDDKVPDVHGDETQLDRAFWNLFSNAIKFTPAGGTITITSKRDDRYVSVSFQDTGVGIPERQLPLLFSQFQRLEGSERAEGTGLGLFIVKTIVDAHHGKIQVQSMAGQGSTFTVLLPIRSRAKAA
jgi:signal transduction histidine kinase